MAEVDVLDRRAASANDPASTIRTNQSICFNAAGTGGMDMRSTLPYRRTGYNGGTPFETVETSTPRASRHSISALHKQRRIQEEEKDPAMTNLEAWKIYERYISAWNTNSLEERMTIASAVLSENIEYQTARHDLCTGRAQVIEDMATFHKTFPGGHFEIGGVSAHHNVALLVWVIIQADGKEVARGGDQITVDRNGKISKITTFAPSVSDPF